MPATPLEVFELHKQAVLALDMAAQAALFAEDGYFEFPFAPAGMPARLEGRAEIRRVLEAAVERARHLNRRMIGYDGLIVHETTDPEVLIAEFEAKGEAAGEPFSRRFIQVFRIRGGKIVSLRDYWPSDGVAGGFAKDLVQRYMAAWNNGDPSVLEQVLAPDWVDHAHPSLVGVAAVKRRLLEVRAEVPDFHIELDSVVAEGDLVAFRRTITMTRDSEKIVSRGMGFMRLAGGRLAEQWTALEQP